MRLAMVTTYVTPRNMRRELLAAAVARGHHVTAIAPEPVDLMQGPMAELGGAYRTWKIDRTRIDPRADLAAALHLYQLLREVRPDVVLAYQIKAVLIAPIVAKLARVPHVVALVNGLGQTFDDHGFGLTRKARLARRLYGGALRAVDTIVFQNQDDPALLRRLRTLPPRADVRVVPGSGVDVRVLTPTGRVASPITFTLVSRLLGSKGIRDFVAAARAIRARHPAVRFRLVGQLESADHPDGVKRTELDGWIAEGLVEYLGFTDDIRGVLASTSVFVLPSYYREGVPRTNLEALAMGLPVVTTDWVGCRDTVEDGVNGFLIPPKDSAALIDRLERYLADPGLLVRHGAASRALAERTFDVARVNQQMLEAMQLA